MLAESCPNRRFISNIEGAVAKCGGSLFYRSRSREQEFWKRGSLCRRDVTAGGRSRGSCLGAMRQACARIKWLLPKVGRRGGPEPGPRAAAGPLARPSTQPARFRTPRRHARNHPLQTRSLSESDLSLTTKSTLANTSTATNRESPPGVEQRTVSR